MKIGSYNLSEIGSLLRSSSAKAIGIKKLNILILKIARDELASKQHEFHGNMARAHYLERLAKERFYLLLMLFCNNDEEYKENSQNYHILRNLINEAMNKINNAILIGKLKPNIESKNPTPC